MFPDQNSIKHIWYDLGKAISQRIPLSKTSQEIKVPLLEKWGLLPQIRIDIVINSMADLCEAGMAVQRGHRQTFPEVNASSLNHELMLFDMTCFLTHN
ncbi:hypothetical protein TNCV_370621 [Trichonephila clavipes]|nr:hypothetical protein TNCV_370621 [Trichonephila clavipes]